MREGGYLEKAIIKDCRFKDAAADLAQNPNRFIARSFAEDPYYSGLRARIPNFVRSRVASSSSKGKSASTLQLLQREQHKQSKADKEAMDMNEAAGNSTVLINCKHFAKAFSTSNASPCDLGPFSTKTLLGKSSGRRSESAHLSLPPQIPSHPFWWHSRLYSDAAMAAAAAAAASGHMSKIHNVS